MNAFFQAFLAVISPVSLLSIFSGTLCGIWVGIMPGLSSVMGMSIMLPLTLSLSGTNGIMMMLGIFCGAIYGGSITAILLNTPGTANSAATCLDGHPMAIKYKQPGRALSISTTASTFGGLFAAVMLLITAPLLAKVALKFSAPEYFALAIFGLSVVTSVSSTNVIKGLIGAIVGLLLATIGMDSFTGDFRLTFGTVYLTGGIGFIPVLIGLFAFSQGLINVEDEYHNRKKMKKEVTVIERIFPSKEDLKTITPTLIRSSLIGTLIGAIPGTGGDIASWVGYNEAKRWSKHPEKFGDGAPDGIAAPEAANNAISGGALIPLLTMGIPGDACTAIMLGALMMQGITPGPLLFTEQAVKVYLIIVGLFFANIFMGIIGFSGIKLFSKIVHVPNIILAPIIFVFCFVGTFAINHNISDVYLMIVCGILGYYIIKMEFSIPPIILGLILGSTIENNYRRAMVLSDGNAFIFFERPISCVLLIIGILSLFYPFFFPIVKKAIAKHKLAKAGKGETQ
ncbi:tripartite tricarboxylate transporter permease [uncultured Sphaerochaeta sp.]|uniref:tripartite tricarboxylate transporter permease n=1 Tax=uncultured Sphaerochaeta sp. TaxID=886478 RepID=UPI002A0A555A|nr:tripartite tricarboxylate transporter permease [uncultured Sphaerochaeta sp.]